MLEEEIEQVKKKLANDIRLCRKKIGITQEELAKRMRVSQPFISKMEKGESLPEKHTLVRLAKALNLNDDYFLRSMTLKQPEETREILNILKEIEQVVKGKHVQDQLIPINEFTLETKVRLQEVEFPVGAGECFAHEYIVGEHWLPSGIANGATHLIRVSGRSMEPFILDGELILVARQNFVERDGQLAVINIENQFNAVKFVYVDGEKVGVGRSKPEASWYGRDEIRVLGIVVNKISSYNVIREMEESARQ